MGIEVVALYGVNKERCKEYVEAQGMKLPPERVMEDERLGMGAKAIIIDLCSNRLGVGSIRPHEDEKDIIINGFLELIINGYLGLTKKVKE